MIQFNLLPDVKLEYIKTKKTKQLVVSTSIIIAGASLALLLILFLIVNVAQKQHLKHLNSDIKANISKLQNTPDLDKVLTIQNQLNSLPNLHGQKPVTSRFFGYVSQLTPTTATISQAKIDFDASTITISGDADSLSTVNKFVDTIKFTEYTVDGSTESKKAFSDVVLSSFTKTEKGVTYQIDFKFDPAIFNDQAAVKLNVPNIITTRSTTEKPSDLFQQSQSNGGGH